MLRPYRDVLARPGALAFSGAGVIARLPMSMVGIAIVLVVSTLYDSYGLAGRVTAVLVIATAVAGPQIARLVDRFGQARAMAPFLAVTVIGMTILVVAASTVAGPVWLYVGAALTGAGGGFGPLVRARWTYALADDPRRVHTAYSLESALDELVFVVGPVLATMLATGPRPELGIAIPAVGALVGGCWFLSQRRTEPPVAPRGTPRPRGSVLRMPGMALVVVVFVAIGMIFGATDVATVAFAQELGHKSSAGLVLAVFALGSMLGGLLYGARHWRQPLAQRFAVGLVLLALGVCLFLLVGNLAALAGVMFVVGFTISPSIITGNGLVQVLVPGGRLTEGLTWVGTAINIGVSFGSSVAGSRVDAAGSHGGFLVVVGAAVAVVVLTLLAYPGLRAAGRRASDETREEAVTPAGV
jgi:MFS family permease